MFSSIGFEVELDLYGGNHDDFFNYYRNAGKWNREYYYFQVERSDFLFRNIENQSEIDTVVKAVSDIIRDEIFAISEDVKYYMPLNSVYLKMYNSLVSNGVHIHIGDFVQSIDEFCIENGVSKYWLFEKLRQFIVRKYVDLFGLNARFVFSHHVWGYYRSTEYDFKRKPKFRPALYRSEYNTLELRIFNLEDLLFHPDKVTALLKSLFRLKFNIERIDRIRRPRIYSRLRNLCAECDSSWFEFVEKHSDMFKSDRVYINDEFNDIVVEQKIKMIDWFGGLVERENKLFFKQ